MKKRTVGQVLQISRRNLQLSLQELSNKTQIEPQFLEALEQDSFELIPSPFYTQIYLQKVSWALGLDEKILLAAFKEGKDLLFDEEVMESVEELHSRSITKQQSWLPLFYFILISLRILSFVFYIVYFYNFR